MCNQNSDTTHCEYISFGHERFIDNRKIGKGLIKVYEIKIKGLLHGIQ